MNKNLIEKIQSIGYGLFFVLLLILLCLALVMDSRTAAPLPPAGKIQITVWPVGSEE